MATISISVQDTINELVRSEHLTELNQVLLSAPSKEEQYDYLSHAIFLCGYHGKLNLIKDFLSHPNQNLCLSDISANSMVSDCFITACYRGQLEVVEYLSTSSELEEHVIIFTDDGAGFKKSCTEGQTEVVKFLTTSSKLKMHYDLSWYGDFAIIEACTKGHVELVKFLLTDSCLPIKGNIEANNFEGLRNAVLSHKDEVVDYLIMGYKLPLCETLSKFFNKEITKPSGWREPKEVENILQKFHKVKHYSDLQNNLPRKVDSASKKCKI